MYTNKIIRICAIENDIAQYEMAGMLGLSPQYFSNLLQTEWDEKLQNDLVAFFKNGGGTSAELINLRQRLSHVNAHNRTNQLMKELDYYTWRNEYERKGWL